VVDIFYYANIGVKSIIMVKVVMVIMNKSRREVDLICNYSAIAFVVVSNGLVNHLRKSNR